MPAKPISDADFQTLAAFRVELRQFLHFSEQAAHENGLTPQQYQALLAIRGSDRRALTIGALAGTLLLEPHSASGLVARLEKLGMIERRTVEDDGRRSIIRLSDRADSLLNTLSAVHRDELRRLRPLLVRLLSRL